MGKNKLDLYMYLLVVSNFLLLVISFSQLFNKDYYYGLCTLSVLACLITSTIGMYNNNGKE